MNIKSFKKINKYVVKLLKDLTRLGFEPTLDMLCDAAFITFDNAYVAFKYEEETVVFNYTPDPSTLESENIYFEKTWNLTTVNLYSPIVKTIVNTVR